MITITKKNINSILKQENLDQNIACYAQPVHYLYGPNQAILVLEPDKITVLYISTVRNRTLLKKEFIRKNIINPSIKNNLLDIKFCFYYNEKKFTFKIMKKVIFLGKIQEDFLSSLRNFIL